MSARTDAAQTIARALKAEGLLYVTPAVCYAVADALIERPGLLRALLTADNVNDSAALDVADRAGFHAPTVIHRPTD